MPRPAAVLAFLAGCSLGGAAWGASVRAYWDLRWRIIPLEGVRDSLLRAFSEWSDVLPIAGGMLAVVGLYRLVIRRRERRADRGWRWEAVTWVALAAAALIWGHSHLSGVHYWGAAVVHTVAARVALLALQLSFRVACDLGRSGARRLGPAAGELLFYVIGRGLFVFVFMKALRLRGENAMYLIVPAGAGLLEGTLLVLGAAACLLAARRGWPPLQGAGEAESGASAPAASGKNS
jgi:hypothetical protein